MLNTVWNNLRVSSLVICSQNYLPGLLVKKDTFKIDKPFTFKKKTININFRKEKSYQTTSFRKKSHLKQN